jgi:GT2 family glycosyltransferase
MRTSNKKNNAQSDILLEMSPKFCIIILNWNGKEESVKCLASLRMLNASSYEIVFIDNASVDDSVPYVHTHFPEIKIFQNECNLGFAEGNNVGIRYALQRGAESILILNNDTIVAPDLLEELDKMLRSHPKLGILGATVYQMSHPDCLDHLGGIWNPNRLMFDLVGKGEKMPSAPVSLDYVFGAGFVVRREVFEKVGLLEPRFFLFWEEADLCMRARESGFLIMNCPGAKIWHKGSSSFSGGKPHTDYFYWRGRFLWIERHFPKKQWMRTFVYLLRNEVMRHVKFACLKGIEYFVLCYVFRKSNVHEKKKRLLRHCAVVRGFWDYALRRFHDAPSWLTRAYKS